MSRDLSRGLHMLTQRLDRAADRILREEPGLSYSRFLALYMVGRQGASTQRELAARLGVSEASVSRMARVLTRAGWLTTDHILGSGNRRALTLTPTGEELLMRWGSGLEDQLASLVAAAGVPYEDYRAQTERVLAELESAISDEPDPLAPQADQQQAEEPVA